MTTNNDEKINLYFTPDMLTKKNYIKTIEIEQALDILSRIDTRKELFLSTYTEAVSMDGATTLRNLYIDHENSVIAFLIGESEVEYRTELKKANIIALASINFADTDAIELILHFDKYDTMIKITMLLEDFTKENLKHIEKCYTYDLEQQDRY